jgi:hypothetical protein
LSSTHLRIFSGGARNLRKPEPQPKPMTTAQAWPRMEVWEMRTAVTRMRRSGRRTVGMR